MIMLCFSKEETFDLSKLPSSFELECSRSFIPTKSGKKVSHCKVKDVDMKSDFFACQVYMTSDYKLSADSSVLSMLELAQYMHRFQDEFVHCIDVSFGNDWFPF